MASTLDILKWTTLTALVNEIKSPNNFLKNLLFSSHQTLPTESIEMSLLLKGREMAPFIRKNGEGVMVSGHSEKFSTVEGPNIRIKRPHTPSELLFTRRPGTVIFSPGMDYQMTAINAHVARDIQVMADLITNTEEYLCAMALQGEIAYSVADNEVFTITFPKPATNNITPAVYWDAADSTTVRVLANINAVKKVLSDEVGLVPTDALCGATAAAALRELAEKGALKWTISNFGQINAGSVDFNTMYSEQGVIFIGTFAGVNFWEYSRAADLNGVSTAMIRTKYIEFVSRSTASQRVMYYAAIPDMKAFQGKNLQAERFSKSWEIDDPSSMMNLVHSRPLPVTRRPGAHVSFLACA